MPRLLLFNPSNDMALAAGKSSYTPPKSIQAMETRMAELPRLWAAPGDEVLTDWSGSYAALQQRHAAPLVPAPWGWSLALKQRLLRFGVPAVLMPSDERLREWRELSNRRFAAHYLQQVLAHAGLSSWQGRLVGSACRYYGQADSFFRDMPPRASEPPCAYIFKSPWSSSGRGVVVTSEPAAVRPRLEGYVRRQGGFVADRFYHKVLDCALEFCLSGRGEARFLGFSVFEADCGGHYLNHYVEPQPQLRARITRSLGFPEAGAMLDALVSCHRALLSQLLGGRYEGPLGIDLLVCEEEGMRRLHPCVEINLRMNMGIVAIVQQRKHPDAQPHLLF